MQQLEEESKLSIMRKKIQSTRTGLTAVPREPEAGTEEAGSPKEEGLSSYLDAESHLCRLKMKDSAFLGTQSSFLASKI